MDSPHVLAHEPCAWNKVAALPAHLAGQPAGSCAGSAAISSTSIVTQARGTLDLDEALWGEKLNPDGTILLAASLWQRPRGYFIFCAKVSKFNRMRFF